MTLSRILAGISAAAVASLAWWMCAEFASVEVWEELPLSLPRPLRLHYLNHVFHNPTEDCTGCYYQLIGTLQALGDHPEAGDGFDYARLFPLLRNGMDYLREPVPGLACDLILRRRDAGLYRAMAQAFRDDEDSLKACVVFKFETFKEFSPAEYEYISKALLEVPGFSKYVPPLGAPSQN